MNASQVSYPEPDWDQDYGRRAANLSSWKQDWLWKKRYEEAIWNVLPPIMIPCGLVCNICAFLVLLQPRLRGLVVHLPLTVLSLVDCIVLLTGLLRHYLRKAAYFTDRFGNSLDPQTLCDACCPGFELLLYLSLMYSSWIIMLIALERFVTICVSPGSRGRAFFISKRGLVTVLSLVFVALLACNLHFPATRHLNRNSSRHGVSCENRPEFSHFVESIFPRIDLALTAFLPFAVILTCNLAIIAKLRAVRQASVLGQSQSKLASYRTTVMLLLTSFAFVLLTSPVKLYLTVIGGAYPDWLSLSSDPSLFYSYRILWSTLLVLQFTNHCCNFLLYCASNPQFRREAVRLVHRCCGCLRTAGGGTTAAASSMGAQQAHGRARLPGGSAETPPTGATAMSNV